MRAIFFVLLLANLVLLTLQWGSWGDNSAPAARKPVVSERVPNLILLAEDVQHASGGRVANRSAPDRDTEVVSTADLGADPLCTLIGPFDDPASAEPVVQRLQALDVSAQVRDIEVPDGAGYWVYLPPELSHRAALRKLHELQSKQIDSYIIPRGDLANGISFGMFSREDLANARQQEMLEQGYDVQIREIERTHREIWVLLPPGDAQQLADSFWDELFERSQELERRQNFCPGVASE